MWKDSIGREWENACGFIATCPYCRALMHTHSLSGELRFNEHGWGVWSQRHARDCDLFRASDATWREVRDRDEYHFIVNPPPDSKEE